MIPFKVLWHPGGMWCGGRAKLKTGGSFSG